MIKIYTASSADRGGCNACSRHISATGSTPHRVTILQYGIESNSTAEARFCFECFDELRGQLGGNQ